MNNTNSKLNHPWIYWILIPGVFFAIQIVLIYSRIKPYDFDLTALIGIEAQMAELNPSYIQPGTILFTKDGYDGEFFYFFSKYFLDPNISQFPIIDSVYFRFHRIGMPILAGSLSRVFSWDYYPLIVIVLYNLFFVFSYFLFLKLLSQKEPWLAGVYLLSPFFLTGELLLVSDPLALGWGGMGVSLFYLARYNIHYSKYYILSAIFLLGCMFIRETGIWLAIGIGGMGYFMTRGKSIFAIGPLGYLYGLIVILYLGFFFGIRAYPFAEVGINPNGFSQVLDFPLSGAFQSIRSNPKVAGILIQILMLLLLLILTGISIFSREGRTLPIRLAILGILSPAYIGDSSYWDTFDNLSRMFTLVSPLLLAWRLETVSLPRIRIYFAIHILLLLLLIIRAIAITPSRDFQKAPLAPKYELGESNTPSKDFPFLPRIG